MVRLYDDEASEENGFVCKLTKWGREENIRVMTIKLNLRGRRGFPDRLVLWEGGGILFIEFKRKGEEPRKLQEVIHEQLRAMGFIVEVHDDRHTALASVQAKIRALSAANAGDDDGRKGDGIQVVS